MRGLSFFALFMNLMALTFTLIAGNYYLLPINILGIFLALDSYE